MNGADDPVLLFDIVLGNLRPTNDVSREALAGLTGTVRVRITRATPSTKRMAWYWVMLKIAADNMADRIDGGLTSKLLHRILKRKLNLGRTVTLPSGETFFDEESISFASMPEADRSAWVTRVANTIGRWLGVPVETLMAETDQRSPIQREAA